MCLTPKDVVKLNTTSNGAIRAEGNCEWSGSAADRVIFATVRKPSFPAETSAYWFSFHYCLYLRQPWGNEWATPGVTHGYYGSGPAVGRVETAPLQRGSHEVRSAHFAVVIDYKDQEQTAELRLTQDIIATLALEAEFRNANGGFKGN